MGVFDSVFGWTTVGIFVPVIVAFGWVAVSIPNPQFNVAQWAFSVAAIILSLRVGLWMSIEHGLQSYPRLGGAVVSFFIFGVIGATWIGGLLWVDDLRPPKSEQVKSVESSADSTRPIEQLTLHYLYEHDFDNTLRLTHPFSLTEGATGKVISFEAQLYQDFPGRSKFLGVYFPHTSADETFKDAMLFAEFYQDFLRNLPESSSAFVGEEMMLSKDLKFSGRVFIYHEDLLTLEQRASLEKLYKSKNLSAQFRGLSYLSGKILGQSKTSATLLR